MNLQQLQASPNPRSLANQARLSLPGALTRLQQSSTTLYQTTHRKLKPAIAVAALLAGSVFGSTAQAEIVQLDLSGDSFSGYLFINTDTVQINPAVPELSYYYAVSYISTPLASDGSSAYTTSPVNPFTNTPVANNASSPYLIGDVRVEAYCVSVGCFYYLEPVNHDGSVATMNFYTLGNTAGTIVEDSFPGAEVTFTLYKDSSLSTELFSGTGTISLPAATPPPVSAVPEPASWAMLLAGVGFIGGAVRYRRRQAGAAVWQYRFA